MGMLTEAEASQVEIQQLTVSSRLFWFAVVKRKLVIHQWIYIPVYHLGDTGLDPLFPTELPCLQEQTRSTTKLRLTAFKRGSDYHKKMSAKWRLRLESRLIKQGMFLSCNLWASFQNVAEKRKKCELGVFLFTGLKWINQAT